MRAGPEPQAHEASLGSSSPLLLDAVALDDGARLPATSAIGAIAAAALDQIKQILSEHIAEEVQRLLHPEVAPQQRGELPEGRDVPPTA